MQVLSQATLGAGFIQLPTGTPLRTSDQFWDAARQDWVMSSFFTSSGEINPGRVPYRRAVSWRAKISLVPAVLGKVWRKRVKPFFTAEVT